MKAEERYKIKQLLKKSQIVKGKRLTKQERRDILNGIVKLMSLEKKEEKNWKPKEEPKSIKEILSGTKTF